MDTSEAAAPGLEATGACASPPERVLLRRAAGFPGAWIALAVALVVPWWLPIVAATVPTFYKEWLCALAFGFAGLIAKPGAPANGSHERVNPFVLAAIAA